MTPSHGPAPVEVDLVLTSKFDKVELIGTGEFSQVYRVTQKQELKCTHSYFSLPLSRTSPMTPLPDRVWAVKKSRNPYIGPRDRQRKLQEVTTLKALGQSDHTLQLFDSWEDKSHLYIQTEFCEEGSLDLFLDQVGRKARLDDFRIWKIMLELCLVGLRRFRSLTNVTNRLCRDSNISMILASSI
jgi:mitosis inhibitor protein kinase SWE1